MSFQRITTVTAAASSYDLTTLAVVKEELGITDKSRDTRLQRYLSGASAAAAQHCNRVFLAETVQDEFIPDADGAYRFVNSLGALQLARWPVISLTSVTENGTALVDGTDFRVDKDSGQILRLCGGRVRAWSACPVTIVHRSGFDPIPDDLVDAVIRMVRSRFNMRSDPTLKQQNIPGVIEQSWWIATGSESGNLTPDVADILENYRIPVIA